MKFLNSSNFISTELPQDQSTQIIQIILLILISGGLSAAVSIGIFAGTTRTKIKNLEASLKETKIELKDQMKIEIEAIKKEFEGKIDVMKLRLKHMEEYPLFAMFKAWQNKEGVVDFFYDLLKM